MKRLLLLFSLALLFNSILSQLNTDSLWSVWHNENQTNENRFNSIQKIIRPTLFFQPDSAFIFAQWQLDYAKSINDKYQMANALNMQGISYHLRSDYENSIKYLLKSIDLYKEIDNLKNLAAPLGNLGIIYQDKGDIKNAIKYYNESLDIYAELNDSSGVAASLNNIGVIYEDLGNKENAIEYYNKSLLIYENIKDKYGIASTLNNIGLIYMDKRQLNKSKELFNNSLKLYAEIQDKQGIGTVLNGLGKIHQKNHKYKEALTVFNASLNIQEEIKDMEGVAVSLTDISKTYELLNDHTNAIIYGEMAIKISQEIGDAKEIRNAAESLYNSYKSTREYKSSLENHELYFSMDDSIQSKENQKRSIKLEYQLQYDSLSREQEKKKAVAIAEHKADLKREEDLRNFIIFSLIVVALFSIFLMNRFRVTNKQKKLIESQHKKLETTHIDLTDSISYAKRIQAAVLPSDKTIKSHLKDSFVIYLPKDIVAGDFYWIEKKNDTILFAAADCTGHGVPGAMVSVFGNNALNRSVREFKLTKPGEILEKSREIIISEFEKSDEEVKDGMDIALCSLNNKKLFFSGAYNPLWIIRKGKLIEVKGDNQPIGRFRNSSPFNTHEVDLEKGDNIYIFSDGYADQFGGEKGKKFKSKNFKQLLISISEKQIDLQKKLLLDAFHNWKGEHEQIDDVCIIGVRI